jgi:hypothetical protein
MMARPTFLVDNPTRKSTFIPAESHWYSFPFVEMTNYIVGQRITEYIQCKECKKNCGTAVSPI